MTRNESRLIDLLVWFCNAKITSTKQVEGRFARGSGSPLFQSIEADKVDAYRNDQKRARDVLARIASYDKAARGRQLEFAREIASAVNEKIHLVMKADLAGSELRITWVPILTGVEAVLNFASALFLRDRSLRRRLGLCAYEECDKFFLDERTRGGKAKAYCSQAHSDIDRVTRWRRLQSAKHK